MSFTCHSHLICVRSCFIYMYLYAIRMSLVCTLCTRMSSVCHSYVLVCNSYVTRLRFYHEPTNMSHRKTWLFLSNTAQICHTGKLECSYQRLHRYFTRKTWLFLSNTAQICHTGKFHCSYQTLYKYVTLKNFTVLIKRFTNMSHWKTLLFLSNTAQKPKFFIKGFLQ